MGHNSPFPLAALLAASLSGVNWAAQPTVARLSEAYGRLPMSFEANRGQTDAQVQFVARGEGYALFLTPAEAVLALSVPAPDQEPNQDCGGYWPGHPRPDCLQRTVLRLRPLGADPNPAVEGLDPLPGRSHYFLGNDPRQWRTDIPTYARVRYRNVYPGVDLVFYGRQGRLEYDVVVAPGVDPAVVRLQFEGAARMELDPGGDLVLHVAGGTVRQHRPVLYQQVSGARRAVSGRHVLRGDRQVGFEAPDYDPTRPLIIDPALSYSTLVGGSLASRGASVISRGVALDSAGKVYVTGYTSSTDFPTTARALQKTNRGGDDAVILKLDAATMSVVYSTYLGGSFGDAGYAIAVDATGQAYVAGITVSRDFPTTTGAFRRALAGGIDVFVAKINSAGTDLVFATLLGGEQQDYATGIAVDAAGNAHVAGQTCSTRFPTTPSAVQPNHGGGYDGFLAKLNPGGTSLVYSTYLGAYNSDTISGVALDAAGNAYVAGTTASENFALTPGVLQPFYAGPTKPPPRGCGAPVSGDAFVAKVNRTGRALLYSTLLGGGEDESGLAVAVDAAGAAYVTGTTSSLNFPTTPGVFSRALAGRDDAFVTKLNPDGTALIYSTYLGGSSDDAALAITIGSGGSAFIAGQTISSDLPITPGAVRTSLAGAGVDAFVTKLDPGGTSLTYSARLGGASVDRAWGVTVDSAGNAYLVGTTRSCDFPNVRDAVGGVCPNTDDGFVTKLSSGGGSLLYSAYLGVRADASQTGLAVAVDRTGSVFITGATDSLEFPTTAGAIQTRIRSQEGGGSDVFAAKLNAAGTAVVYSTYLGGGFNDEGRAIAVDASGSAFIAGATESGNFPVTAGALQRVHGGPVTDDAFVTKLSPSGGSLEYSTFLGRRGADTADGIAVDSTGAAYVTGSTASTNFPTTAGALQTSNGGGTDAFVARLNAAGTALLYSSYLGGSGNDVSRSIALDASGNAYVAGMTESASFPITAGAFQTAAKSFRDAFVSKINPAGAALVYSTRLGGGDDDLASAVAVDSTGAASVVGYTYSADFPTTVDALQAKHAGHYDAFLARLNPSGAGLAYGTYIGGEDADLAYGVALDASGSVYVTGSTLSRTFPVTPRALQTTCGGPAVPAPPRTLEYGDAFILKVDPASPRLRYATYFGGSGPDSGVAIAVDPAGAAYLTGWTRSTNFPVTPGVFQGVFSGSQSAFVAKVDFTLAPAIFAKGVVNAASSQADAVAPGSIATIYGVDLALAEASAAAAPLPAMLGGASVAINGRPAPLFYASPGQLNVQVPVEIPPGPATAVVTVDGRSTTGAPLAVSSAAPGIFLIGNNRAVALNQDGSLNAPESPAAPDSVITVFLTGQGLLDNPVATGAAAPLDALSKALMPARATVGGAEAPILFLGLTPGFVGLAQANIKLPPLPRGDHPLLISVGGAASNAALVAVAP